WDCLPKITVFLSLSNLRYASIRFSENKFLRIRKIRSANSVFSHYSHLNVKYSELSCQRCAPQLEQFPLLSRFNAPQYLPLTLTISLRNSVQTINSSCM